MVSNRAAHFCACGIAALLRRMQRDDVTIGVDGSVFRFHPTFKFTLDQKIKDLVGDQCKVGFFFFFFANYNTNYFHIFSSPWCSARMAVAEAQRWRQRWHRGWIFTTETSAENRRKCHSPLQDNIFSLLSYVSHFDDHFNMYCMEIYCSVFNCLLWSIVLCIWNCCQMYIFIC